MNAIQAENLVKKFGTQYAVNHASFTVEKGELFGMLGPNGAGKTTSLRIILDIFKPDSGTVSILGGSMTDEKKNCIGYLPEERGLYQDIPLDRCLLFLSSLKGMNKHVAGEKIDAMLKRFDLWEHCKKKVKELSKGMQQKAQIITTLVHDPELVIIDEPFSGLDPVNTRMVKEVLLEERDKGKTIVMCTHQMHQVEELCDRLVLINKGKEVLFGSLDDIRRQFATNDIMLRTPSALPENIDGVEAILPHNSRVKLVLKENATPQQTLKWLLDAGIQIEEFEIAVPTLDEIFIRVVQAHGEENE